MAILEYILLAVLFISALFIIVAVIFQKSADEGLSGTIAGGNETFYGKDKSAGADKMWFKWTLIACLVFAIAVLTVYVIQPDYTGAGTKDYWTNLSEYSDLFD